MASQTRAVDNTGFGANTWTNPTNAYVLDATCATTSGGGEQEYNFVNTPFSIPGGATITGVQARVLHAVTDNDDIDISLFDATDTERKLADLTYAGDCADLQDQTVGGDGQLFGGTWTPAHINSADFIAYIDHDAVAKADTCYVDYIEVTVYYTEAAAGQPYVSRVQNVSGMRTYGGW